MPDGPIRLYYQRLHDLHASAGWPSMRELQRASRSERRPRGINPTTIHDAFSLPRLARWAVVEEIVTRLGGDVDEFGRLWRHAREVQAREADLAVVAPGAPPPPAAVPRELPAEAFGFTGRRDQLKWLAELVAGDGTPVVVAVIAGTAGVGKTALAVHWAHQVSERFPDGQLYANLRGYARSDPVLPVEALAQFLRSLGVPADEIPTEQESAAARYRSLLADRRVLVVLDNAADAAQVRPLLPAGAGSLVLVTSRDRLSGLVAREGARRLSLDVLGADEAHLLLARILGADRVAAEPDATGELARACSFLPLALRLAAAAVIDRPGRRIADHVAELRRDTLAGLEIDDEQSGVRATFDLSYRALAPDLRRLFRLSGLVPGPDLTPESAAALVETTTTVAGRLLERLAAAHLLTEHSTGRYTSHDLLLQYAAESSRTEDTADVRQAALRRLFDRYLQRADAAARLLYPDRLRLPVPVAAVPAPAFDDAATAMAWLDAERGNLVAAIAYAAAHGPRSTAWLLADTLRSYFWLRMHTVDLTRATRDALRAAEADGDPRARASTLLSLSNIEHRQRRYVEAIAHCTAALALAERSGWEQGQATALGVLATVHRDAGKLEQAAEVYGRALTLYRRVGSLDGEALTLNHLARTYWYLARFPEALESATRALALRRQAGSRQAEQAGSQAEQAGSQAEQAGSRQAEQAGSRQTEQAGSRQTESRQAEAAALSTLGEICHATGRLDEALDHLSLALTLNRQAGDRGAEAYTLRDLAEVYRDHGQSRQALDLARTAVAQARLLGDVRIEADALNTLGTVYHHLGQERDAVQHHELALEQTRASHDPFPRIEAFLGLSAAWHGLGRAAEAREYGQRALTEARRTGFRILEKRADRLLGSWGRDDPQHRSEDAPHPGGE
ncbi:tetratricopeptide repeat protein [Plantactinospora sp. B6F1]|uniref:ATP-binding protein n=1 Tax=Plantactinospora sp. B6F1 TaxID=3158971 RepID=UPI0032D95A3D